MLRIFVLEFCIAKLHDWIFKEASRFEKLGAFKWNKKQEQNSNETEI